MFQISIEKVKSRVEIREISQIETIFRPGVIVHVAPLYILSAAMTISQICTLETGSTYRITGAG